MFCPECGHPLESAEVKFCPNCGSRVIAPTVPEPAEKTPQDASQSASEPQTEPLPQEPVTTSKLCTAALLLGAGAFVFAVLTCVARVLSLDLRIMGAIATGAFFLAPLACCFGVFGIVARAKDREKRGLPSAIAGLLLGLVFGLLAAYCLLLRIFRA